MFKNLLIAIVMSFALLLVSSNVYAASPDGTTGPWADVVTDSNQSTTKSGGSIATNRSDPSSALGLAETSGSQYDSGFPSGSFFSLGFGGDITLEFENSLVNADGPDLRLYEVTGGNSYPEEIVSVDASADGVTWYNLGTSTRDGELDLGNLSCAHFIRITDVSDENIHTNSADAYDLDAVEALNWSEEPCTISFCKAPTVDEPKRNLGTNRWVWNGDEWETKNPRGRGPIKNYSSEDTLGCGCTQILDRINEITGAQLKGHYKFGCSSSILDAWIEGYYEHEGVMVPLR